MASNLCNDVGVFDSNWDQRVAYRIGNLSNAEISDFFVYRIVYRIEPPISSISIFSKPMIFLSFFAENSKNSPKILKIRRKFAENSENSPKILKIRRKFLKKKVFFEALISYRIVSYREKNPHIVSISYRIEKKLIAQGWTQEALISTGVNKTVLESYHTVSGPR